MSRAVDHWPQQARHWTRIGPPLRPVAEDLAQNARWLAPALARLGGTLDIAILGVTPELALMPWPSRARLVGIDRAMAMARDVWPLDALRNPGQALNGDWRLLPLADRSLAWVIGDGSLSMLDAVSDYDLLSREIVRALRPGGRFSVRLYLNRERPERPEEVIAALLDGETDNFHAFKLRLAMAMCSPATHEVRVGDVFDFWHGHGFDHAALEARLGIPRPTIATIDNYRGSDIRYNFPPPAWVEETLSRHFAIEDRFTPSYTLGERCPTVLLRPL